MNFKTLLSLFTPAVIYSPVVRAPQAPGKKKSEHSPPIYNFDSLSTLIEVLKSLVLDEMEPECKTSIRYIVKTNGNMLFAQEGRPGRSIPAHRQMSWDCLAAGNIFFNDDFTEIIAINNQSGDFKPQPHSIIWPLKILLTSPLAFSQDFTLRIYNADQVHYMKWAEQNKQDISALQLTPPVVSVPPVLPSVSRQSFFDTTSFLPADKKVGCKRKLL